MFLAAYSLTTLCLMAAVALILATLLRLADRYLKLLRVMPSPLNLWRGFCEKAVKKLNRSGRSSHVLQTRARALVLFSLIFSALFAIGFSWGLELWGHDMLETVLLALMMLILPKDQPFPAEDSASHIRHQIEEGALLLMQQVGAPIAGWLLFGWAGVFMMVTLIALRHAVAQSENAFASTIQTASQWILLPAGFLTLMALSFAAAFTSKGKPLEALRAGMEQVASPYKAVFLSAAQAMGVSLGGPKGIYRHLVGREWLGKGIARQQQADLKRWHWLLTLSQFVLAAILLALSLLL